MITKCEDHIYQVINAGCADKDLAHFDHQLGVFGGDVKMDVHWDDRGLYALQGPKAMSVLQGLIGDQVDLAVVYFGQCFSASIAGVPCFINRCGYTGEDGFEIFADGDGAVCGHPKTPLPPSFPLPPPPLPHAPTHPTRAAHTSPPYKQPVPSLQPVDRPLHTCTAIPPCHATTNLSCPVPHGPVPRAPIPHPDPRYALSILRCVYTCTARRNNNNLAPFRLAPGRCLARARR